ncbi:MAG TPA: class I SAM-dependent methyltransferase [Gaiellales bacterium]|nr:class I SAM-dependent methyltransferase [Gaiellales bacterium]
MSDFSRDLIGRSGYDLEGYAGAYDDARPGPPEVVLDVLERCAGGRPRLVVDLGSGTGLSSRAWAGRAGRVIGVEANPAMLAIARAVTGDENVVFVEAYADETGLETGSADIITCAQAFHWMDPSTVLPEVARLLRPGGVFAAYDYDAGPVIEPRVDAAFARVIDVRWEARERLGLLAGAAFWPKSQHADRIRESGLFAFVREVHCHGELTVDGGRVVELADSLGGPSGIFRGQAPELDQARDELAQLALELLPEPRTVLLGYSIRLGIRTD